MSFTAASLADGQISNVTGAVYTSTGVKSIIKAFEIYNTGSSVQVINIFITRNGSVQRQIMKIELSANGSASLLANGIIWTLSTGDTIDADATNDATIDYTIMGATE